ncbi:MULTISPECIES: helix-turn-helix domain-containing protein [Pirellulaceae]|uniref:helix-turn-helix domain-containing protein n=1 Tax=Pirellulaceae TaxID=2691357 RepID=UPI001304DC2F|nr:MULTISPECIES: helix-turn-helix transcriptional regulator [Pirellulaceae]
MPLATDEAQLIGERIREARKSAGLTQADLAKSLGIAHVQISYYERGEQWPNIQRLMQICKVLGTSPDRILGF